MDSTNLDQLQGVALQERLRLLFRLQRGCPLRASCSLETHHHNNLTIPQILLHLNAISDVLRDLVDALLTIQHHAVLHRLWFPRSCQTAYSSLENAQSCELFPSKSRHNLPEACHRRRQGARYLLDLP